jgi:hypothetical protein
MAGISLLCAYLLIGIDYATVYYSDINLFYIFTLGLLFQMQTRMLQETKPAASMQVL